MALSNRPRILHGAFAEFGLTVPPLVVEFQFNPEELGRSRSLTVDAPNKTVYTLVEKEGKLEVKSEEVSQELRQWHQKKDDLLDIRDHQVVTVEEEKISFDIRLDATDKLAEGDAIAGQFGIAPQLAALEMMALPKSDSLLTGAVNELVGSDEKGHRFNRSENPPLILFIWGLQKVLPVNINSLEIKESEFSTYLSPIRATVSVNLTVIEGKNPAYLWSKLIAEEMAVANLANVPDVVTMVIPL